MDQDRIQLERGDVEDLASLVQWALSPHTDGCTCGFHSLPGRLASALALPVPAPPTCEHGQRDKHFVCNGNPIAPDGSTEDRRCRTCVRCPGPVPASEPPPRVGDTVRYWTMARSGEPTGTSVVEAVSRAGQTPAVYLTRRDGKEHHDWIALTHVEVVRPCPSASPASGPAPAAEEERA